MLKVVVVDDNKPLADRIANTISWKEMGCEVVAVEYNGAAGKKAILHHLPELIIADVRMPLLSGLDMVELIRDILPKSKVIFISAYDSFDYAYKAIKLSAFDYLIKPFTQAEMLAAVRKAVDELDCKDISASTEGESQETDPRKTIAEKAIDYLKRHIREKITITDLAAVFGMSSGHLSRLIYRETGKHFLEIATELRMDKAKELLRTGGCRVSEIADIVGYSNYVNFYKVFCKMEGMSPTDYANPHQTNQKPQKKDERT